MQINRLPRLDDTNGWSRILEPRAANPALSKDTTADWLIIGAGYAGLAAARRLAENRPDDRIAIVDAGEAGENSSGRNSGFAIDLPHNTGSSLEELQGAQRYMGLARAAIDYMEKTVREANIQCDWVRDGKYHAAVSSRGARDILEPLARELEALDEPFEWLDKPGVEEKIGSSHFTAAVYTPGCVLMNPAALTRGLADSMPDNVTLYENSPVTEINYQNGVHVRTPSGSLRAPKLILAVNGFAERFGFLEQNLVHIAAHASLTRPLSAEEQGAYGVVDPWGLTPANAFAGITMRYTNDRRILIRQNLNYAPSQFTSTSKQKSLKRLHQALFDDRFPMLKGVEIEHTWSGYLCFSRNGAPGFGQAAPNIWTAVCQNGVGVTKGTIAGLLAADMACGRENPLIEDMQGLGVPSRVPPQPFVGLGVRTRMMWELWNNRHER